jgi:hypothetical protein
VIVILVIFIVIAPVRWVFVNGAGSRLNLFQSIVLDGDTFALLVTPKFSAQSIRSGRYRDFASSVH